MHGALLFLTLLLMDSAMTDDDSHNYYNGGGNRVEHVEVASTSCTIVYSEGPGQSITFYRCSIDTTTYTNWKICLNLCCHSQSYSTPSQEALQYCQKMGDDQGLEVWIIALIVISVLLVAALVIFCLCRCCTPFVAAVKEPEYIAEDKTENWHTTKGIHFYKGFNWEVVHNRNRIQLSNQTCTICLQDDTTAELNCGHRFHPQCIGGWLKKSLLCPCCRRSDQTTVKIVCSTCRCWYYVCSKQCLRARSHQIPLSCETCDNSSDSGQKRTSIIELLEG